MTIGAIATRTTPGRFTKQDVIARLTEAGLRTRRGLVLSPQSFGKMVRNWIYVGRVESQDYGVSTSGDFEPLIDEATFYSGIIRIFRSGDSCGARRAAVR